MTTVNDIIWNHSIFDQELYSQLEELQDCSLNFNFINNNELNIEEEDISSTWIDISSPISSNKLNKKIEAQEILIKTEKSCYNTLQILEKILEPLRLTLNDYEDVTGRTNSIVTNCEMLLEKQVSYYN